MILYFIFYVSQHQLHPFRNENIWRESLKTLWENQNTIKTAKQERIKRGIEEGIEKGAHSKAIEMKKEGMPVAQIIRFTGLNEKDIKNLD